MEVKTSELGPLTVAPAAAARLLGIGRTGVFKLMATHELRHFKCGRRTLIRVEDLRRWVDERAAEARKARAA